MLSIRLGNLQGIDQDSRPFWPNRPLIGAVRSYEIGRGRVARKANFLAMIGRWLDMDNGKGFFFVFPGLHHLYAIPYSYIVTQPRTVPRQRRRLSPTATKNQGD